MIGTSRSFVGHNMTKRLFQSSDGWTLSLVNERMKRRVIVRHRKGVKERTAVRSILVEGKREEVGWHGWQRMGQWFEGTEVVVV